MQVSERVTGFTERWGANKKDVIYGVGNEYSQKPLYNIFKTTGICFYFLDEQIQNTLEDLAKYIGLAFCRVCSIQENDIGWGTFSSQASLLNPIPIKGFSIYDSARGSLRLTKQIPSRLDEILEEAIRILKEEDKLQIVDSIEYIGKQIKLFNQAQENITATEVFATNKEGDWKEVIAANQLALYNDGRDHINEQVTVLSYVYTPDGIKYFLKPKYSNSTWQIKYEFIKPIPGTTKIERYNINTGEIEST
jgi:hypothetical protein